MKRYYASYEQWEDWQSGQYVATASPDCRYVHASRDLLARDDELREAMFTVVTEWPVAAAVNMTNRSRNRRAWLGQAACCLVYGATETETKLAWHMLTESQQATANAQADAAISFWAGEYNAEATDWSQRPGCSSTENIADV